MVSVVYYFFWMLNLHEFYFYEIKIHKV